MTGSELRDLLRSTAADGSDSVEVDEELLVDRIRRRRKRSSVLLAGGVAVVVAVVGAATAWVVQPDDHAPAVAGSTPAVVAPVPFPRQCGAALLGDHPVESPLRVSIERQEVVRQQVDREYGRVTATLTNSSNHDMAGSTASTVRLVVVKDGAVVATTGAITTNALPVTLGPGQSKTLVVPVPLRHCSTSTAEHGGPELQPGTYQLYTEYSVAVASPSAAPGAQWKVLRSGPWTVTLK
ncbi:hypothetical protein PWY87_00905 [Kribbella solani]|uniref:hypothetical protein n=1 Tax=Kribbella solani TaxID=236067 RepID=UPI0029A314ED|nr:hypothetical protein [Kribbella solani]MDX2970046.1 hypothetical protein [Kribbella solani]MDX3000209.1 hypothetical protein [Kribbella solani]